MPETEEEDTTPDLDTVLDELRQAGVKCGLQVVSPTEIVAWLGDIQEQLTRPWWQAWGPVVPTIFIYKALGANAVEDIAKWLRLQDTGHG